MKYDIDKLKKEFRSGKKLKYLFFWGHQKPKNGEVNSSCLSQWWSTNFSIDGITYYSTEQYMMAEKARLFRDEKMLSKIIDSKSPGQAKQYGREVLGFDEKTWIENRCKIVKAGNFAKFNQDKVLREYLTSTSKRVLVEASPVDSIWGIGLAKDNEHCTNPLKWKGMNLLGFALMEVRDKLLVNK